MHIAGFMFTINLHHRLNRLIRLTERNQGFGRLKLIEHTEYFTDAFQISNAHAVLLFEILIYQILYLWLQINSICVINNGV